MTDPEVAAIAPAGPTLTPYDQAYHSDLSPSYSTAHAEGIEWREIVQIVLHIDPDQEQEHARKTFESHLARAQWMTEQGYRHLLKGFE